MSDNLLNMLTKKKSLVVIAILIVLCSFLGVSYAVWQFSDKQNTFDTLGTKCFELTMTNASSGIHLDKISPTPDEEGKKGDGYTFTITNTCNTNATYQVNLEELALDVKRLSNKYIKISLNDSDGKVLNTYDEVTKTIDNADTSHKLTSGSLEPDESVTYNLKLWMDESTPAIDEVSEATFESKVTVIASYIDEEKLENEIQTTTSSKTENFNKESETVEVTVTSDIYDIIEVSYDGVTFTPVEEKGKTVTITKTYDTEGTHKIYFKDEMGNIKEQIVETTKLDQTSPTIEITPTDNQETIDLSIKLSDTKSGLNGYKITESSSTPTEWDTLSSNEETKDFTVTENKTYYIWVKDKVGNVTYEAYSASTIDTTSPELDIQNTLTGWGTTDSILVTATDDLIGLSGVSISIVENEYHWELIENSPLEYTNTFEVTESGTYYVSVKDAYNHITTKSIVIDKVDSTNPVISEITNSTNGDWTNDKVTLSWSITESDSGIEKVEYSLDNETWNPLLESEWNGLVRENERNDTLYIRVTDKVGHVSAVQSTSLKIDKTNPSITSVTGNPSDWTNGDVTLTINGASDESSGLAESPYSFDNGATWQAENTKVYAANTNDIVIKVKDIAGNVYTHSTLSITKIDKTAPDIISLTTSTSWATSNTVTARVQDSESGIVAYAWSNSSDIPATFTEVTNILEEQTYTNDYTTNTTVYFFVKDALGNLASESVVVDKVDTEIPKAKINASVSEKSITVSGEGSNDTQSGVAKYYYSKDGGTNWVSSTSNIYTFTNSEYRDYDLALKVEDGAGRVSEVVSKTVTVNPPTLMKYASRTTTNSAFSKYKSTVSNIVFQPSRTVVNDYVDTFDESIAQDNSVVSYVKLNSDNTTYTIYVQSYDNIYLPTDSNHLFADMRKLATIEGLNTINTSRVTDMSFLFWFCQTLTSLDLSNFDTSNVTLMNDIFCCMLNITTIDISSFDTRNVTTMRSMFNMIGNSNKLANIIYGEHFNTSKVTDMGWMFFNLNFTSLDLSKFDTSNVTTFDLMFNGMKNLTGLDLSSFNTEKATNMMGMFGGCSSLTTLDLSGFDTSNVSNMSTMFNNMASLVSLNLSNFNTSQVTSMGSMFSGCSSLASLDLSNFDTSNVTTMNNMFYNCSSLTLLNISTFNTSNVTTMNNMFNKCAKLATIDVSGFNTSNVTDMTSMFDNCTNLKTLNLSHFNTEKVTNMRGMFGSCTSLTSLDVSSFSTPLVTNMYAMFYRCSSLTSLNLGKFDTSKVTNFDLMFNGDSKLTSITYGFNFTYVSGTVASMYGGCPANKPTHSSWSGKI